MTHLWTGQWLAALSVFPEPDSAGRGRAGGAARAPATLHKGFTSGRSRGRILLPPTKPAEILPTPQLWVSALISAGFSGWQGIEETGPSVD